MEMDTCILEVGREFVISKYDKLPSSAWRRVCSGSPGAAASRGAAGQTVNVLPADGETSEGDRWTSLFPRGSVSPSCLASVSAALADTEAMLHAISPFLHASAARLPVCSRHALDKTLLGKAAATLHQAVFKSGFSLQFQEVMAAPTKETLKIADGTTMEITRLPDIDDATWAEVKQYVESNPETAKSLQNFAKNPEAMRGWLQTQAIAEHYNTKLTSGDAPVQDRVKSLEQDPELKEMFEDLSRADIKKNGMEAAMKYYQDETLMLKISQKMGGLPEDLQPVLRKIEEP
eukprot:s1099_g13.t2